MEYLNRIELRGKIGHVKTNIIGEIKVTNFSLVTECMTQSNLTGIPTMETTWHQITAWEGTQIDPNIHNANKNTPVYVKGRLRVALYTDAEGREQRYYEVLASELKVIDETV